MKIKIKSLLAAILALVMALSLAACGGKDKGSDENSDKAETIVLGKYTAVFKGYTLTKDEDGNDAMILTYDYTNGSKEEESFAWAFFFVAKQNGQELGSPMFDENGSQITRNYEEKVQKGQTLEVALALTLVNTTDDVTIVFSDFDDHEYTQTIKLSCSGGKKAGPEEAGSSVLDKIKDNPGGGTQLASQDYWSGDWYGWWHVTSADGYWENLEDAWFDCCARIEKPDESSGYIVIWDEDGSGAEEYMAECAVSFGMGTTKNGAMMSEDGSFWDCAIEHADWIVDPGASVVSQYDHMICIDGSYEDPENDGGFDYKIYLRPWGMDWEDVAAADEEMLPYNYETWYLPAIQAGEAMPDVIGSGDFLASGEVPDSQMEGQGTGGEVIPDSGTLGEYGFSVADATGVVPLDTLKAACRYIQEHSSDLTYGAVYAQMGNVHGVAQTSGSAWQSGKYEYKWSAESGEYLYVVFSVDADGNEFMRGKSNSLGLGD